MDLQPTDFLSGLGGIANLPHPYDDQQQVINDQQRNQIGAQQIQEGQAVVGLRNAQATALQQKQQQEQQYQDDVQSALKTRDFASLYAKYPDQQKALQASHDALDEPARKVQERDLYAVSSYIKNGAIDSAKSLLQKRIDADKAAGEDPSHDQQMFDALASGDPAQVKSVADMALYAILPADKRSELFGKEDTKRFTNTPQGDIYDTSTGAVMHAAGPKPEVDTVKVFDENGAVVGSRRITHPVPGGVTGPQLEQLALNAVPGATVTSGARTPAHNAEVGGVSNSYHLTDQARDLTPPPGMSMAAFHNVLQASLPGVKVLNEGTHVHIQPIARSTTPTNFQTRPVATVGPSSILDSPTIGMMAEQYLAGDKSVMQNLGRGKQGAENIVKLRKAITAQAQAQGLHGADIAAKMADFSGILASERTAGTRIANVELASSEAQNLIPLALKASDALPRNGFLPFSRAQQKIRSGTNDPNLRRFVAANNALVNVYSRAVSPTGAPTVADKEHARELLDTAYDQPSYRAVVGQMQREISAARAAPRSVRADLREAVAGRSQAKPPAGFRILAVRPK